MLLSQCTLMSAAQPWPSHQGSPFTSWATQQQPQSHSSASSVLSNIAVAVADADSKPPLIPSTSTSSSSDHHPPPLPQQPHAQPSALEYAPADDADELDSVVDDDADADYQDSPRSRNLASNTGASNQRRRGSANNTSPLSSSNGTYTNGTSAATTTRRRSATTTSSNNNNSPSAPAPSGRGRPPASSSPDKKQQHHPEQHRTKRKKANRACASCQKAHLTCDDERPCQRCIKRKLADTCTDGRRKKAKYLRDYDDDVVEGKIPLSATPTQPSVSSNIPENTLSSSYPAMSLSPTTPSYAPAPFDTLNLYDFTAPADDFGSQAANLEYAVLSSMLDESRMEPSACLPPSVFEGSSSQIPAPSGPSSSAPPLSADLNFTLTGQQQQQSSPRILKEEVSSPITANHNQNNNNGNTATTTTMPSLSLPASAAIISSSRKAGENGLADGFAFKPVTKPTIQHPPVQTTGYGVMKVEDVYRLDKPYPYTQAYHHLIRHIKESRFEKSDILRIVRALAIFRPSLIALQIPLTKDDEVFVERCFQRTLIEYDKLISLSGTPTVVWRRTCEICLVGTEFCLLTEWSREDLIGGNKFIFELFDSASTVEYYEQFASHAFENTSQAVTMSCTILSPSGRPVPCSFCFTIQRDMFNLPSLIVGSFLPILA